MEKQLTEAKELVQEFQKAISFGRTCLCTPQQIATWESDFLDALQSKQVSFEQLQAVIRWYGRHKHEKYVPKALTARVFLEKFNAIVDAHIRAKNQKPEVPEIDYNLFCTNTEQQIKHWFGALPSQCISKDDFWKALTIWYLQNRVVCSKYVQNKKFVPGMVVSPAESFWFQFQVDYGTAGQFGEYYGEFTRKILPHVGFNLNPFKPVNTMFRRFFEEWGTAHQLDVYDKAWGLHGFDK